jgi:hypothetical protein
MVDEVADVVHNAGLACKVLNSNLLEDVEVLRRAYF